MTPFDGRNPKVGVNHVHFCLSPFDVSECLDFPHIVLCAYDDAIQLMMMLYNLIMVYAMVEDDQEMVY